MDSVGIRLLEESEEESEESEESEGYELESEEEEESSERSERSGGGGSTSSLKKKKKRRRKKKKKRHHHRSSRRREEEDVEDAEGKEEEEEEEERKCSEKTTSHRSRHRSSQEEGGGRRRRRSKSSSKTENLQSEWPNFASQPQQQQEHQHRPSVVRDRENRAALGMDWMTQGRASTSSRKVETATAATASTAEEEAPPTEEEEEKRMASPAIPSDRRVTEAVAEEVLDRRDSIRQEEDHHHHHRHWQQHQQSETKNNLSVADLLRSRLKSGGAGPSTSAADARPADDDFGPLPSRSMPKQVILPKVTASGALITESISSAKQDGGGAAAAKRFESHDEEGKRISYFTDDNVDLQTLLRQQKSGNVKGIDEIIGANIMKRKSFKETHIGPDEEYEHDGTLSIIGKTSNQKKKPRHSGTQDKASAERQKHIAAYQRAEKAQQQCYYCLSNPKTPKHLIVAIGQMAYLR